MNMDSSINPVIQEVEDDLPCSPQNGKKIYNKYFAMSFQIQDTNSYNNLDKMNASDDNDSTNAPAINDDDDDDTFVMRGKSSTISKCCDVEVRPAIGSIALKRKSFILQQRMSIQIPSAIKIECAANKEEIQFSSKYALGKKLGEGVNAVVKVCYEKEDGGDPQGNKSKPYAVKVFKTENVVDTLEVQRESQILQQLNHPTIIKFKDLIIEKSKNKAYLVQEFARGKALTNYLAENCEQKKMDELTAIAIIKQLLQGLNCLHTKNFCHFDMKPDNIIYNELDGNIKIIDFSSSRKSCPNQKLLTNIGTLNYKSPEYFGSSQRNTKSDIWSVGDIFHLMTKGNQQIYQSIYPENTQRIISLEYISATKCVSEYSGNQKRVIQNIKDRNFQQDYKSKVSSKMVELLDLMLVVDPQKRLSASQILQKLPQSIELQKLSTLKPKQNNEKKAKVLPSRCSIMNFDLNINKVNAKQNFNDIIHSPEYSGCKTDRNLKMGNDQIDLYKNMGSYHLDHLVI